MYILDSIKEDLACLLEGKEPSTQTPAGAQTPTAGRKKKRSVSTATTLPSTGAAKVKYGCPEGFKKVTEYLCLHYRKDSKGNGVASTFDSSKKYCQDQSKGASLLYFKNTAEASKVWKWLGK